MFSAVLASYNDGTFANKTQNSLPWNLLSQDMKHFHDLTQNTVLIMGNDTAKSICTETRKLPILKNRFSLVITSKGAWPDASEADAKCQFVSSWNEAIQKAEQIVNEQKWDNSKGDKILVVGGKRLFEMSFQNLMCKNLYWTKIYSAKEDTTDEMIKLDTISASSREWNLVNQSTVYSDAEQFYQIFRYERKTYDELYVHLVKDLMNFGSKREDRTGVGTLSLFGRQLRFNLRNGEIPLLTIKKVFWRSIVAELLWFLSGNTNAKILTEQKVHIWDGNTSREFLDNMAKSAKDDKLKQIFLNREPGDCGPNYGFQWRHFGAKYVDFKTPVLGGVDQIENVIRDIKNNPFSRRLIVSAWNPVDIESTNLPPCHSFFQFYVDNGELSCHVFLRSNDAGLGMPTNCASYSLLTNMIAYLTDLKPGELVYSVSDLHWYADSISQMKEISERKLILDQKFPTLLVIPGEEKVEKITDFKADHFKLYNYFPQAAVRMKMAI